MNDRALVRGTLAVIDRRASAERGPLGSMLFKSLFTIDDFIEDANV